MDLGIRIIRVAADDKLFMSMMKGELVVARASPKAYEQIGRSTVIDTGGKRAFSGRLMYRCDDKEIVCLGVRKRQRENDL